MQLVSRRYNRATMWDQLAAQLAGHITPTQVERRKGSWLSR
jgi:hypothetical protein